MCGFLWPKTFLSRKVQIDLSGCDENLPGYNATNASPKHEVMPYQGLFVTHDYCKTSLRRAENFLPSQGGPSHVSPRIHILASKHLLRPRNLNACLIEARSWCKGKAWFGREVVSQRKFIHTLWILAISTCWTVGCFLGNFVCIHLARAQAKVHLTWPAIIVDFANPKQNTYPSGMF